MNEKILESWVPTIVIDERDRVYVTLLVEAQRCAECARVMVAPHGCVDRLQPRYYRVNLRAQIERAGWCFMSGSSKNDRPICDDCQRAGLGRFVCSLCENERADEPVESWDGDALCRTCYETVPAKAWIEKRDLLEEAHRYDYC